MTDSQKTTWSHAYAQGHQQRILCMVCCVSYNACTAYRTTTRRCGACNCADRAETSAQGILWKPCLQLPALSLLQRCSTDGALAAGRAAMQNTLCQHATGGLKLCSAQAQQAACHNLNKQGRKDAGCIHEQEGEKMHDADLQACFVVVQSLQVLVDLHPA